MNEEFQRAARRDKKALSEQCKEIEENNRMGKTRESLQENWKYQGNISCKDGHSKGQKQQESNRSREDDEEMARKHRTIQKDLYDLDNHDGVVTHLDPDF